MANIQRLTPQDDQPAENRGWVVGAGIGAGLLVVYGLKLLVDWWNRNETGPSGGFGIGFGSGTDSGVNLDPTDKGKWNAGEDEEGELDSSKWERRVVAGVDGWRRKGIPLPGETGGPATHQAAFLIVGNGSDVPDLTGWPDLLPVFLVHEPNQQLRYLFDVDGGWGMDARFGDTETELAIGDGQKHWFACAVMTSAELKACAKKQIEESLDMQWV